MGPQEGRTWRCLSVNPGTALSFERQQQQEQLVKGRGYRKESVERKAPVRIRIKESKALTVHMDIESQGADGEPREEKAG